MTLIDSRHLRWDCDAVVWSEGGASLRLVSFISHVSDVYVSRVKDGCHARREDIELSCV